MLSFYIFVAFLIFAVIYYSLVINEEELIIKAPDDTTAEAIKHRKLALSLIAGAFWPFLLIIFILKRV